MADSKPLSVQGFKLGPKPRFLLIAAFIALPLSGCSSVDSTLGGLFGGDTLTDESAAETAASAQTEPTSSGFVFGGDAETRPRFTTPDSGGQGAPDLNSVPSTAPTPSPQAERDEALVGLIADRANSRHTNQSARTMPVTVRPLEAEAAPSAEPPVPEAAAVDPVTRLAELPPPRPVEAGGDEPASPETSDVLVTPPTPPTPARPAAGPRQGAPPLPTNSIAGNQVVGTVTPTARQFMPLSDFDANAFSISSSVASLPSVARGLTQDDRRVLIDAAAQRRDVQGVLRVIGHGGNEPSAAAVLAVRVAEALLSMDVPANRLYVGADAETGPVEVILDY